MFNPRTGSIPYHYFTRVMTHPTNPFSLFFQKNNTGTTHEINKTMRLSSMLATKTTAFQSSNTKTFNVAIVGGGITGSCAASVLTSLNKRQCEEGTKKKHIEPALDTNTSKEHDLKQLLVRENIHVHVDLFDQGRSGVGGRTSHRRKEESFSDDNDEVTSLRFDHGCQVCFFHLGMNATFLSNILFFLFI